MRNLQITVIALFLVVAIAFSVFFCFDRLTVDHTAPKIICDGVPLQVSVYATDKELCAGLTASDDTDGDITDRIIVRKTSQLSGANTATVYYAVFDSASNYCTFSRPVIYNDYRKPRFSLSQPLSYPVNSTVLLSDRLTATDLIDGDISSRIRISSNAVSVTEPGEYPTTVQVTNSLGDTASVRLTVAIESTTSRHPTIMLSQYIYYVTMGETLDEQTLRGLIKGARTSAGGTRVDADNITITSEVNTDKRGAYPVTYSYTNDQQLTRTVTLTVVVE